MLQPAGLGDEVLGWIEGHVPTMNPDDDIRLRIDAMDDDAAKCDLLARAGYRAGRRFGEVLCAELDGFVPEHAIPDGMVVRDCVDVDEHARAQCHRDAWSSLDHIGRPDAVSQFHDHIYRALRRSIRYNPELDLVVATADGDLAACSIAWADDVSRFGVFEPVGTCPGYRGLRLSALLVEQSMLRLRERGMKHAYVMSSESNKIPPPTGRIDGPSIRSEGSATTPRTSLHANRLGGRCQPEDETNEAQCLRVPSAQAAGGRKGTRYAWIRAWRDGGRPNGRIGVDKTAELYVR